MRMIRVGHLVEYVQVTTQKYTPLKLKEQELCWGVLCENYIAASSGLIRGRAVQIGDPAGGCRRDD
jgi:hypothetical protein